VQDGVWLREEAAMSTDEAYVAMMETSGKRCTGQHAAQEESEDAG
jgi:hypothetical protein